MLVTLASVTLTWPSGAVFLAAAIFGVLFLIGGLGEPRTWRVELLGFCLFALGVGLYLAGVK